MRTTTGPGVRQGPTILQIVPELDTGGAELSAIEIAAALVRAGARALVATEGGRMLDRLHTAGAEVITLPVAAKNPLTILANARRLARLVAGERVDILHARSRAPAWSALIAARRTGCHFVTTYHGAYGEKNAAKRLYNSVMVRSDRVIANSEYTAGLIRARYGTPAERIRVIHRGVDPTLFATGAVAPDRLAALRQRWGAAHGRRIVLQAARLTHWKGQHVLIEAAARLAADRRLGDAIVILAGDDQGRTGYREQLDARIAAAGLGDQVRLVGHVEDIAAAFALAHVAVVASVEPEAFGRTAAEAEAMGCPVIATDIGAPRETVLAAPAVGPDRMTGWLVPPGDAAAMAECLAAALALGPAERAAIGARARAHVATNFTLAAMQHATLAVYDELLGTDLAACFARA